MKPDRERLLRSFGRFATGKSDVYQATNVDEVNEVFAIARERGQRIAIRGGGHSFNGQALHDGDAGKQVILSTHSFEPHKIEFDRDGAKVTLGSGVPWRRFVDEAVRQSHENKGPILIPGSMQTGGKATVGGTLSGDCLSRSSGMAGKESLWIDSFRILTPTSGKPLNVSEKSDPDLFHAVIGGHGYIGFVTDATYRLTAIDHASCVHTEITTHESFGDLIEKQRQLIDKYASLPGPPRGISSAWFTDSALMNQLHLTPPDPSTITGSTGRRGRFGNWLNLEPLDSTIIRGIVFNSSYAKRSHPKLPGFPLYNKLHSTFRYLIERAARIPWVDWLFDQTTYTLLQSVREFDDDPADFLFFMDGDAAARTRFERKNKPKLFPIVQQTFVIPTLSTEEFAKICVSKMLERKIEPSESDLLFIRQDECLMSANYRLAGFAVSFAFEASGPNGGPSQEIVDLLRDLSVDCLKLGGRIHLPKNSHVDKQVFREMFSPQIVKFEEIKLKHDPEKLLQNPFSDKFFQF